VGQLSLTSRLAATWPTGVFGPWCQLLPGTTTITERFENQTLDAGANAAVFARLYESAGPSGPAIGTIGAQTTTFSAFPGPQTFSWNVSGVTAGHYVAAFFGSNTSGNTNSLDVTLFDDLTYCTYGTRQISVYADVAQLSIDILLLIFGAVTDGWGWALLIFFVGQNLNVKNLCLMQRPAPVNLTGDDIANLADPTHPLTFVPASKKAWQWLQWAAWPYFCECVPGSPSPVPPPVLVQPAPTGVLPGPPQAITCNNDDLCSALNRLTLIVNAISSQVSEVKDDVALIQRQKVPFAYIPGALHTGLTGAGTIVVGQVLGLSVITTAMPGYFSSDLAPVASWFKIGELSWGTANGWSARRIVTHNPHLFLDLDADITEVAFLFEPGVTANILELVREPIRP
jgi:hypothetical protein